MDFFNRLEHWGDTHHPKWVDFVRIALGVFLCIKGIQFPGQASEVMNRMPSFLSSDYFFLSMLQYYVLFAHLLGGICLIAGVFVRFACLIQIPILLGALVFIHTSINSWSPFSELFLAVIVLLLLVYFLIVGNGKLSLAKYLREGEKRTYN
ncbi:MAG TPA: DoxX family protein [Chitinophagaceae bacterium]|nr:DoxX family protein [Chitinophagaceae bacterium]